MLIFPSFICPEFSPVLSSSSRGNSQGPSNSYEQTAKHILSTIIIFTNTTTAPGIPDWNTICMQETAIKVSSSRSLVTFAKISIQTKYFKLFSDIGTAIGIDEPQPEERFCTIEGRKNNGENQMERSGLHSPTLKQARFFCF